MGNLWSCLSGKGEDNGGARRKAQQRRTPRAADRRGPLGSSARLRTVERPLIKGEVEEVLIHDRAIVDTILQRCQIGNNGLLPLHRSSSLKFPTPEGEKSGLSSSTSSRTRSLADPLLRPQQLVSQVILVGHDFGGVCISHAMESFPSKIAKAVFISAAMLTNGRNALDVFSNQVGSNDLMRQSQIFLYANGSDQPPTAIDLDKPLLKDLLFNESPSKDVALASVSMRPIPFAPVLEKLSLSNEKYGSVRRFYIETAKDNAIPLGEQQTMINLNPPECVFHLKGSDHSPFFSKPQALYKHLVEIATAPPLPAG